VRRSTSRCSAQSRTTSPAGRHNCGIGSSSQLATVIGAMNAGRGHDLLGVCEVESARIGCRSHRSTRGCPGGTPQKYPAIATPRGRSLELRERRAGKSLGPSRTPSRRRPPRPTAQAVPGDEDRCVGPIGSQSARQTPQPFVQLSEPTSDAVWTLERFSRSAIGRRWTQVANFGKRSRFSTWRQIFPRFEPTDGELHVYAPRACSSS
jgi:hypothetical protein